MQKETEKRSIKNRIINRKKDKRIKRKIGVCAAPHPCQPDQHIAGPVQFAKFFS
jgi:hypothetical protein